MRCDDGMWGIERKAWWRRTAHPAGWGGGGVTPYPFIHAVGLNA